VEVQNDTPVFLGRFCWGSGGSLNHKTYIQTAYKSFEDSSILDTTESVDFDDVSLSLTQAGVRSPVS